MSPAAIGQGSAPQTDPSDRTDPIDPLEATIPFTALDGLDSTSQILASDGSYYNAHPFWGEEGQRISIELVSEEFAPYLMLFQLPEKTIISEHSNGVDSSIAQLTVTLPRTGSYAILANSAIPGQTGVYVLTVEEPSTEEGAEAEANRLYENCLSALENWGEDAEELRGLLAKLVRRDH